MNFYNQDYPAVVGSYTPSENWNKWTQFAVMDANTNGLIACCGYFQNIEEPIEWGFDEYKHAAECIEQAQLYANAPQLFDIVSKLAKSEEYQGTQIQEDAAKLINAIKDISEPAKRLLGDKAMKVIDHILEANK